MAIQECRSSSLSVSEWCRQRGVATTTYYRWERELLTAAKPVSCSSVPAATFAELPEPKKMSRNVAKRFATVVLWGVRMTSAELKHQAELQEWAAQIQNCRSSGPSVRAWCRQERINASTYYRWERELLTAAKPVPCSSVPAVTFAELSAPKKVSRNVAERSATLHIGSASLDIYSRCDAEQLKMLVELLRLC